MTLTIDLTPQEAQRVEEAKRRGFDFDALIRGVIAGLPSKIDEVKVPTEYEATHALFEQWREEDASMTPEEIKQAEADWEAFKKNINTWRAQNGEEPVYP